MESSAAATGHPPVPQPLYPRADTASERIAFYKPLRGPARATALMLGFIMLVDLAAVWFGVLDLDLIQRWKDGAPVTDEELAFSDSRLVAIGSAQLVAYLMCAVVFIFWFHRAYTNVDAIENPSARRYGTGWAIGGWFVPILNWWRPKQIANDLWTASSPHDSQRQPGWLLRFWWITRRMEAKATAVRERDAAAGETNGRSDQANDLDEPDASAGRGDPEGSEAAGGRASVAQPWTTPPTT